MINLIFFSLRNANGSPSCYMPLKALSPTPLYYPLPRRRRARAPRGARRGDTGERAGSVQPRSSLRLSARAAYNL